MNGELAEMVFTDPPYNINYEGGTKDKLKIMNDNMQSSQFYRFLHDFYDAAFHVTKEGGAIYVCHGESEGINFRAAMQDAGWLYKQCLIWVKSSLVIGRQDYQWKHEPILYGWKPGTAHRWYGGYTETTTIEEAYDVVIEDGKRKRIHIRRGNRTLTLEVPSYEITFEGDDHATSIWRFEKPLKNGEHPTMKPIGLVARAIVNSSKTGDAVLDGFGGSGTTMIAAEQTGRRAFLCELDPKYCDVIVTRWEELTGQQAELLTKEGEEHAKATREYREQPEAFDPGGDSAQAK
jgi:DNA modification methylase